MAAQGVRYKITVEELTPNEERPSYPNSMRMYEQTVDHLDVRAVITAVNSPRHSTMIYDPSQIDSRILNNDRS